MKMLRLLIILTLFCGVLYPIAVTVIGKLFFSEKAEGSLIFQDRKLVGSELLAQKFVQPEFFHPRPSAGDYATIASVASQSSPTQKSGTEIRELNRKNYPEAGVDFWTMSGSGLDPHISPKTAYSQIDRIAAVRSMSVYDLRALIDRKIEGRTWGIWGQPRVNVLKLNLELLSQDKNANTR